MSDTRTVDVRRCVACGGPRDVGTLLMCRRCSQWFVDFARDAQRVPLASELPRFMVEDSQA